METTIQIPDKLKTRAEQAALARGLSLDEFVRQSLEWMLAHPAETDSLFTDQAVYTGEAPDDLSIHHDQHLYGDDS
jgi:hypothetical protein